MKSQEITKVDVSQIIPGDNDRTVFDEAALNELAASIASQGLLQPVTVRRLDLDAGQTEAYEIVAGERRFRACVRILGWQEIPAIIADMTSEEASAAMLTENMARQDLDPIDEGRAYQKRIARFGWTAKECAEKAGVSIVRVRFRLKLLSLQPDMQKMVKIGQFDIGYAQIIAGGNLDNNRQRIAYQALNRNPAPTCGWLRRVVSELAEQQNQEAMFTPEEMTGGSAPYDPGIIPAANLPAPETAALFDIAAFTITQQEDPPEPGKVTPPADGSTHAEIIMNQVNFWEDAARAWDKRGKSFKRQECVAAAAALRSLLAVLE